MAKLILMFAMVIGSLGAIPARAQEATPEPGPQAALALPEAAAFGDGWRRSQIVSPEELTRFDFEMEPGVFREGAAGIYVGPEGSRIVVASLLISESRVAIRESWDEATELLEAVTSGFSSGFGSDEDLEAQAVPAGCVEAKHIEGIEDFVLLPVGGTMCAIDPDGILVTVVYGAFNGQDGVAASDAATGITLGS